MVRASGLMAARQDCDSGSHFWSPKDCLGSLMVLPRKIGSGDASGAATFCLHVFLFLVIFLSQEVVTPGFGRGECK